MYIVILFTFINKPQFCRVVLVHCNTKATAISKIEVKVQKWAEGSEKDEFNE